MKIAVILPVHDEAPVLGKAVETVLAWGRRYGQGFAMIVSENGSKDGTLAAARASAAGRQGITVISSPEPGKGGAIKRGLAACDADVCLAMDIDLSTDLSSASRLIEAVEAGADLAIASRRMPDSSVERPLLRKIITATYGRLTEALLGLGVRDAQCGCKAFSRKAKDLAVSSVRDDGFFFDTELLARAAKSGLSIAEIGVRWHEPAGRKSKVKIMATSTAFLRKLTALRRDLQV
jgi:dolichyl-phosphate beta-glucosyltransferase